MTRSLFRYLPLLALWLAAPHALAHVVTLEEIETKAQRERAELVERRASIEKAQAEVAVAQSHGGPTLGARAEGGIAPGGQLVRVLDARNPDPDDFYLVSGSRELGQSGALTPRPRYAALLSGKITILDFGRSALGVKAAEAALGAERATLLQAKVELVRAARSAYLSWFEAHQTWQLAQKDAEVTRERTISVKALISEGARPATDASLSSYDEQLAGLRQSRAARAAAAALQLLAASVESELPAGATPDLDVLKPPAPAPNPQGTPASTEPPPAAANGPRDSLLAALELQRQAALSAARAADRGASPVLDAAAEVGVQGQDSRVFPVYKAGVTLSVPIWDGGLGRAQAAVHRAEARGIEARLQASERRLRAEQTAARARFQAAAEELHLSLELLTTAELVLSQAEEHYRSGSDTLERVLNAQRSLVQARREVLTAQLETARARLELTPIKIAP
ncbi:MAG: TolC family protein [Deltaproteobacteria bacterium]